MSSTIPNRLFLLMALLMPGVLGCQFSSQGQNQAGVQQFQMGNSTAAVGHFQEALRLNPRSADAYYNLGALYHRYAAQSHDRNYYSQAESLYYQCLTLEPNHADCHRGYAVLLAETNRADQAFQSLKQWNALYPTAADPKVELARLYQEYGDKQSADMYLQQAVQANPQSARAWAALGKLREEANDPSQALALYQRAYQINPAQPGVYERMAALSRGGVNPLPTLGPPPPGSNNGTRMVNAPGPMRRF